MAFFKKITKAVTSITAPSSKKKTLVEIHSELDLPCEVNFIVYKQSDFKKIFTVTVDPYGKGSVHISHYATLIVVEYPTRAGGGQSIARQEWIDTSDLRDQYHLVLTPNEPLIDHRTINTNLKPATTKILQSEDPWHKIHLFRDRDPSVEACKGRSGGRSPIPPSRRTTEPAFASRLENVSPSSRRLSDPGLDGGQILQRARKLCCGDSTAVGGWSVVGTTPSAREILEQISREFGAAASTRYQDEIMQMVENIVTERDPARAAELKRIRELRAMVRFAPWVDAAAGIRPVKCPELPALFAIQAPSTPTKDGQSAVDCALKYDFSADEKALDDERAAADAFDTMLSARAAEVEAAHTAAKIAKEKKIAEAAEAEAKAKADRERRQAEEAEQKRKAEAEAAARREREAREAEERRKREAREAEERRAREAREADERRRLAEIQRQERVEREKIEAIVREAEREERMQREREARRLEAESEALVKRLAAERDAAYAQRVYEEEQAAAAARDAAAKQAQCEEDARIARELQESWK